MASQMIDSVLSTEKECDKRLCEASEKAAAVRSDAEKKQAEILKNAREESKKARNEILAEAQKESECIQSESDKKTAEEVKELKDGVRRKSGAAVDEVTKLLLQIS